MIILSLTLGVMLLLLACRFGLARLARLATLEWRGGALAVLACAAQSISVFTHQQRLPLLLLSAALLAWFCWLNRRHPGVMIAALGITLNMVVMAANGGTMPVSPTTLEQRGFQVTQGTALHFSKNRVLADHMAALPWLGDRLLMPGPLARLASWSIGDMVLLVGVWRLLWQTLKGDDDAARRALT
jgi:hypothetical protein